MFGLALAAGAIAGGGLLSSLGAKKNADSQRRAADSAAQQREELFKRQSKNLNKLANQKEKKLLNLGNIFKRFESTGAFGNTKTLQNLRKAQRDFSELAAGDFTRFESQLKKSMSDALVRTVGSGSPVGAYAGLAADAQMDYRLQGVKTAVGISEFTSNEAMKLLGAEFGVMDQRFEMGYKMDADRVQGVTQAQQQAAQTAGVGYQALGNTLQQAGSLGLTYGMHRDRMGLQQTSLENERMQIAAMAARAENQSRPSSLLPTIDYSLPTAPISSLNPFPIPGGFDPAEGIPHEYANPEDWVRPEFRHSNTPSSDMPDGLFWPMTYHKPKSSILSSLGSRIMAG